METFYNLFFESYLRAALTLYNSNQKKREDQYPVNNVNEIISQGSRNQAYKECRLYLDMNMRYLLEEIHRGIDAEQLGVDFFLSRSIFRDMNNVSERYNQSVAGYLARVARNFDPVGLVKRNNLLYFETKT